MDCKNLGGDLDSNQVIRLKLLLEEYKHEIRHIASIINAVADAISRLDMDST